MGRPNFAGPPAWTGFGRPRSPEPLPQAHAWGSQLEPETGATHPGSRSSRAARHTDELTRSTRYNSRAPHRDGLGAPVPNPKPPRRRVPRKPNGACAHRGSSETPPKRSRTSPLQHPHVALLGRGWGQAVGLTGETLGPGRAAETPAPAVPRHRCVTGPDVLPRDPRRGGKAQTSQGTPRAPQGSFPNKGESAENGPKSDTEDSLCDTRS